ncbi:MAG: vanadium-dependent haloperoxidase [Verrucomicrobiales bacterium]|nr:vanadium-dependent haloperoxidase [Verrucomicrobiales bacterium]
MYDAWAVYDPVATGFAYRGKQVVKDATEARRVAISYAAYHVLVDRFKFALNATETLTGLRQRMLSLGLDPERVVAPPDSPEGVGLATAAAITNWFLQDGSRQAEGYEDLPAREGGYQSFQPALDTGAFGVPGLLDVNRWQPLVFTMVTPAGQNGSVVTYRTQPFLGSQWLGVRPFTLMRTDIHRPWIDPGPPPRFGGTTDAEFHSNVVAVIRAGSQLSPDDGVVIDISPGAVGNNPLGENSGSGHPINPVTGQPYAPNPVLRGDFARVLAEFWADGPNSETPPGHWNVLANQVSDSPGFTKRIGGKDPLLDDLEWDVKLYFALNAALHDAACAAWSLKRYYDGWRPLAAIRYTASLGQNSEPTLPRYHPSGLPLIPGLIELTTPESIGTGKPHEGLSSNVIVVRSWIGPKRICSPFGGCFDQPSRGVQWVDAQEWIPYQRNTFVTPAFPGYISGHSTFSRAAAEVLAEFTGSRFFPGGLGTHTVQAGDLGFESGPSAPVQLQWATYEDAADQAGLSRIWGGIHPPADDVAGRRVGFQCGHSAWDLALRYFDGSLASTPISIRCDRAAPGQAVVRFESVRGLYYHIESASRVDGPYMPGLVPPFQATDTVSSVNLETQAPEEWVRIRSSLTPQIP